MNKENKSGNARHLLPSAGFEALSDLNFNLKAFKPFKQCIAGPSLGP